MIGKSDVKEVLEKYFGQVTDTRTIAQVVDEIAELEQEWEQLDIPIEAMGFTLSTNCPDICFLADQIYKGERIRLFRQRKGAVKQAA